MGGIGLRNGGRLWIPSPPPWLKIHTSLDAEFSCTACVADSTIFFCEQNSNNNVYTPCIA
jgi:hypothetical protein